ncbi:hypothetical protein Tco_0671695 [Tanacetum coccineum]
MNGGLVTKPEVPNVPEYRSESEEESWTYSQGDDDKESNEHDSANEDDEQQNDSEDSKSEDDGDEFVHPTLSTYKANEKEEEKAEDDDEVISNQKVSTPPDYELTEEAMKDEVNVALQLKSNKLREEAQAENQDFLNLIDSNMKKIIKKQAKAQTSKIISEVQKNLYNALVEAYNSEKDFLSSYGDVVTIPRGHDDADKDEEPSESRTTSSSKRPSRSQQTDLEDPTHQEFITGDDGVSLVREVTNVDERLWNPTSSQTPDREWNKTKTVDDRPPQPWMS